jgi:hypothetical protein
MTYDPMKSASSKTGVSSISGIKDYIHGTFAYDDKSKLAQSAIERRTRSLRKGDNNKMNQSVTEGKNKKS